VDVAREIAAAPADAWRLLTDTRTWPAWGPSVADVDCDPPQLELGLRGRVRTAVGVWLPFVVTTLEPGHRWSWRVAGIPATGHRVEPTASGCRVVFEVPLAAIAYVPVCQLALRRIERLLAARQAAGRDPDGTATDG
jgi:uncharacterized protein YndB with AHSA1/START domain